MADRVTASIVIGGKVTDLEALINAIAVENLGPTADDVFNPGKGIIPGEEILKHLLDGAHGVSMGAHQVAWGMFDELEAECQRQGLSYRRTHDGHDEWNPGHVTFRPGGEVEACDVDHDGGNIAVTARDIRGGGFETLEALLSYLDGVDSFSPGALEIDADQVAQWRADYGEPAP